MSRCNITLCNTSSITSDWVSDCPGQTDRSASGGCGTVTVVLFKFEMSPTSVATKPRRTSSTLLYRSVQLVNPGAGTQGIPSTRHRGTRIKILTVCWCWVSPVGWPIWASG